MLLVLMMGLLTACGQSEPKEETGSGSLGIPADSILLYNDDEGSAELIEFFAEGNVPEEANILYDQMGSNPDITITDADTIKELFDRLSKVEVVRETNESITDCYHHVQFKLGDDDYIYYSFEGSEIWCSGTKRCSINDNADLFGYMRDLTDEYLAPGMGTMAETTGQSGDGLYQEAVFDTILIEYPSGWKAEDHNGTIVMSKDGTENSPFFSVEEIGWVESPGTFLTNQMNVFKNKYGNQMAMPPESTTMEVAGMKLAGFTAQYSSYDGTATITRLEYVEVIDDITYHFVCEYVSSASGDQHE
ncbi:MAG: hypothetical protein ACI4PP_07515, partial [Clostridia bacterium]